MSRLGFRTVLGLSIAMPLLGLLYFAGGDVVDRYGTWRKSAEMAVLIDLAGKSSAVVHEVQKERGSSAGYLGAKGAQFGPKVQDQRLLTDQAVASLRNAVNGLAPGVGSREFTTTLKTALSMLEQVQSKRDRVDVLKIDLTETLEFYTAINTHLLDAIAQLAHTTFHPTVTRELLAYASFLHSKEVEGLERALLSNVFGAGNFQGREHLHERLVRSIAIGENFRFVFELGAGKRQREFFNSAFTDVAVERAKAIRDIGVSGLGESVLGLDARYWFDIQTEKINILKNVEDYLHQLLLEDTEAIGAQAKWTFVAHLLVTVLLVGAGLALGHRASRMENSAT